MADKKNVDLTTNLLDKTPNPCDKKDVFKLKADCENNLAVNPVKKIEEDKKEKVNNGQDDDTRSKKSTNTAKI